MIFEVKTICIFTVRIVNLSVPHFYYFKNVSFLALQKEARHQEAKDSETKEDERPRKQYPFTCVIFSG